jgi:hypothetical protein
MPVEPRDADWEPAAVVTVKVPEAADVEVGLKRTVTVQFPPTDNEVEHVVETNEKAAPDTEAELGTVTLNAPMPVLLRVAVAVLLEFTAVAGNTGAESDAEGACPVPLRATDVAPEPLCVRVIAPVRAPAPAGVKVTLMVQLEPTATLEQLLDCEKSLAPEETDTEEMVKAVVPLLPTVTVCTALLVPVC